MLSPEERSHRARLAAYARHQRRDPVDAATAARRALWARYEAQVDPENTLEPEERRRRARCAMQADLARAAFVAAKRRREAADQALADRLLAGVPA